MRKYAIIILDGAADHNRELGGSPLTNAEPNAANSRTLS
jgi:hypothetical protein